MLATRPSSRRPTSISGAGFARVVGGVLDIGAVERDPVPVEAQEFTIE
jgi:hypothetical protein